MIASSYYTSFGDSVREAQSRLNQSMIEASEARRDAEKLIKTYPLAAITVCLTMGVLLGWIIKRR